MTKEERESLIAQGYLAFKADGKTFLFQKDDPDLMKKLEDRGFKIYYNRNNVLIITRNEKTIFIQKDFKDMSRMFYSCGLTSLDLSSFNTENVYNMDNMFEMCKSLTSLDLSNFDTEYVTSMREMFRRCERLKYLDLSNFNTKNVRNMSGMFDHCYVLATVVTKDKRIIEQLKDTNIDCRIIFPWHKEDKGSVINSDGRTVEAVAAEYEAKGFGVAYKSNKALVVTSNEKQMIIHLDDKDMGNMFESYRFNSIDLSSLRTKSVINMYKMFYKCWNLTSLDLSNFDTKNVMDMGSMFEGCENLTSLNLSNFNTENVLSMSEMFCGCENLKFLDLSSFRADNVTHMGYMFNGCKRLTYLDLSNFVTDDHVSLYYVFRECDSLETVITKDERIINYIRDNYKYCRIIDPDDKVTKSIAEYKAKGFDVVYKGNGVLVVTRDDKQMIIQLDYEDMSYMFEGCEDLTSLDLSNFNTENVENMDSMFEGCENLTSLNLSNFNTENVENMDSMFYMCKNITSLDLSSFDTRNVSNMYYMFAGCKNLTSLDLSSFDTSKVTDMRGMFKWCENLTSLDLSSFSTKNIVNSAEGSILMCSNGLDSMFAECRSLQTVITKDEKIIKQLKEDCPNCKVVYPDDKATSSETEKEAVSKSSFFS